ncbi:diguanylate cyclase (GGDEF) domain-containing protein [Formivibrio citricus]|uniref:diguanylate cyclase n=1 Tax=Formivibrio citricus TaxID=83765 RepID=A0A1I4V1Q4_9NEIS|nr:GGDEF domain-containing protein [Formivibrio citricus]SFM95128.1 diguanylate cyclase (GGDEF) domain-containing protein [Formivibrio citricus]
MFGSILAITLAVSGFAVLISRTQKSLLKARNDLERMASIDDLTQVMTRRVFFEHAEREFARAKRQNEVLSVLMLDIDSFKHINDVCGHGVGDLVLSSCAETWAKALRGHDYLGRLGGEEFCVLLPEADAQSAVEVANRLRKLTEELAVYSQSCCKQVTVSIGVASLTELDTNWQTLLNRADQALYRAKNGGRNRVET